MYAPEVMVLAEYAWAYSGRRVLELGVGAGRLTRYLQPLSSDYLGIDLSPDMLAVCGRRFPGARLEIRDIRNIAPLGPSAFDFVMGAFNIIDVLPHDGRLQLLADVCHLVPPGGVFVFSSHNRRYRSAGRGPRLARSRNPVTQLHHVFHYAIGTIHHRRTRPQQRIEADYALLNDVGCDWRLLHYYVDRARQAAQLRQAGFDLLAVYDERAKRLSADDDDSESAMLYYVARRS